MSTALRIASVTYVLKDLLNNGLINHDVTGVIGEGVAVTTLPPDQIKTDTEKTQINLFMYQATYNSGWRNVAQPSISKTGERLSNPPLAIDLHYLLSAFAVAELHTEILLGYAMQLMHENPVLGREAIRTSLAPPSDVPGDGLPSSLKKLSTSKLADQIEMIKITPETLSIEDISKLWAAFGAHYRPTAAYKATVVLIESEKSTNTALPVQTRKLYVSSFKKPVIDKISSRAVANQPVIENQKILPGYILVIKGHNLKNVLVNINVDGVPITNSPDVVIDNEQISFLLPAGLSAGTHELQIVHPVLMGSPPVAHAGTSSNTAIFMLSPVITNVQALNVTGAGNAPRSATIQFDISPDVQHTQQAILLLNDMGISPQAYSFPVSFPPLTSPPVFSKSVKVQVSGIVSGSYLVRLLVEGAESILQTNGAGNYVSPSVNIL